MWPLAIYCASWSFIFPIRKVRTAMPRWSDNERMTWHNTEGLMQSSGHGTQCMETIMIHLSFTPIYLIIKMAMTFFFHKTALKVKVALSLFVTPWTTESMDFSRPEYGVGSLSLLQGIFPTHGSNPGLPHCRQILYQLSYQRSPKTTLLRDNLHITESPHCICTTQ